jgi:hypothetical protein
MRLDYLLGASVKQGFADLLALLLAHGASPNGRDFYDKRTHIENGRHFPQARSSGSRACAAMKNRSGI